MKPVNFEFNAIFLCRMRMDARILSDVKVLCEEGSHGHGRFVAFVVVVFCASERGGGLGLPDNSEP